MLIDTMIEHGLEQLVHFPTREKNTLDLLLTSLPGQFQDIQSPDKLSDHGIVAGTMEVIIPPIKKPRGKVYLYQKGDYESMRKDALEFAKEKYFFDFTAAGVVPCGGRKTSPRTSSIVQFIFYFGPLRSAIIF